MAKTTVSIYDFSDYREYLKEAQQALKEIDRKYSHRFIAKKVGVDSSQM